MDKRERIDCLVKYLNKCCDEYYNKNNPSLSDAQYDALFDELSRLETETGYVRSDSPTMRAGYEVLSELKRLRTIYRFYPLPKQKAPQMCIIWQSRATDIWH